MVVVAGDHQEGRGGAHDDRESGPSEHQTSFPHSKFPIYSIGPTLFGN